MLDVLKFYPHSFKVVGPEDPIVYGFWAILMLKVKDSRTSPERGRTSKTLCNPVKLGVAAKGFFTSIGPC